VRIVREDGLECFGVRCRRDLRIPELWLAEGRYQIEVDGVPIEELLVNSHTPDHGCLVLPHGWSVTMGSRDQDSAMASELAHADRAAA
jgi:hypothetical protein